MVLLPFVVYNFSYNLVVVKLSKEATLQLNKKNKCETLCLRKEGGVKAVGKKKTIMLVAISPENIGLGLSPLFCCAHTQLSEKAKIN